MGSKGKRNEDEPEPWKNAKLTDDDEVLPSSELEQKKLVVLNPADCDPDFIIEGNGLHGSSLYEQGFAYCWSGARANMGITGGKYCFGCKVVSFQDVEMKDAGPNEVNLCRVGISRGDDVVGSLGETSRSFGYGSNGKFLNSSKLSDYGEKFVLGDIIICAVNLEEKPLASISFSKNGKCLGTAMEFKAGPLGLAVVDSEVKNLQWESAVFPHVLLKNVGVELQFSVEDGLVPEEGFKPWASALEDENAIVGPVVDEPTDCEVMMMVGMPGTGKTTWAEKWVKEHPEKRYVLLGIDMVLDQMKVPGHLRVKNYDEPQCYHDLISRSSRVLRTLLSRAGTTPRNYILDGTNVYKKPRKFVIGSFKLFKKIAVVVFPSPEKENARFMKRREELGVQEVFANVMYKMLANYVLPVSKDMPGSDELFDEVMFVELNREESQRRLDEINQVISNLISNDSSPCSGRNCVPSCPFAPNCGESPVLPYPIPSPQCIGASAGGTSITSMATMEPLIGSNIRKWIADIKFLIGDAPAPLTDASTDAEKVYLREWTIAYSMTKFILKSTMSDTVKGSIPDKDAREYLYFIEEKFKEREKAIAEKIKESERAIAEKIKESEKAIAEKIKESEKAIAESEKAIAEKIKESEKAIAEKIKESEKAIAESEKAFAVKFKERDRILA